MFDKSRIKIYFELKNKTVEQKWKSLSKTWPLKKNKKYLSVLFQSIIALGLNNIFIRL